MNSYTKLYTNETPCTYPVNKYGEPDISSVGIIAERYVALAITDWYVSEGAPWGALSTEQLVKLGKMNKGAVADVIQERYGIDLIITDRQIHNEVKVWTIASSLEQSNVQVKYQPLTHCYNFKFNAEIGIQRFDKNRNPVSEMRPAGFGKEHQPAWTVYVFTGKCAVRLPTAEFLKLVDEYKGNAKPVGNRMRWYNNTYEQNITCFIPVERMVGHPSAKVFELHKKFVDLNNKLCPHGEDVDWKHHGQEWTSEHVLNLISAVRTYQYSKFDELLKEYNTNGGEV